MQNRKVIETAVILAAGRGSRLGKYTDDIPKCLVEVNKISIVDRMLSILKISGVKRIIFVLGYKSDSIKTSMKKWESTFEFSFVENKDWESTNNVVSLYLAIPAIMEDFYLLESDLVFSKQCFDKLSKPNKMAVSTYLPTMNGTGVTMSDSKLIQKMYTNLKTGSIDKNLFKTVNLYSIDINDFKVTLCPEIERLLSQGKQQVYYEAAFGIAIDSGEIKFIGEDFSHCRWYEIDTELDLQEAEILFSN